MFVSWIYYYYYFEIDLDSQSTATYFETRHDLCNAALSETTLSNYSLSFLMYLSLCKEVVTLINNVTKVNHKQKYRCPVCKRDHAEIAWSEWFGIRLTQENTLIKKKLEIFFHVMFSFLFFLDSIREKNLYLSNIN